MVIGILAAVLGLLLSTGQPAQDIERANRGGR
jgi:hypothetical protein